MNLNNVLEMQNKYRAELAGIAQAIADAQATRAGNAKAAEGVTSKLVDKVKAYATLTHADGADTDEARKALAGTLATLEMPKGSIKASGNHFAGFRKLLTEGKDITPLTTKDAQEAVESEEVKAVKAARAALNAYAKAHKWGSADWLALLELGGITSQTTEGEDAETAEVEAEAREAA